MTGIQRRLRRFSRDLGPAAATRAAYAATPGDQQRLFTGGPDTSMRDTLKRFAVKTVRAVICNRKTPACAGYEDAQGYRPFNAILDRPHSELNIKGLI